jgi:hypothetical protein
LGFRKKEVAVDSTAIDRTKLHYVLQIRSDPAKTSLWEDLIAIKASNLESKDPGLGIFACRPFKRGDVISLYGGVPFKKADDHPMEYHIGSFGEDGVTGIILDAQGPIDEEYPPFLGAHMVNDPYWKCPLESDPLPTIDWMKRLVNTVFNNDFTFAAKRNIKTHEELLAFYNLQNDTDEDTDEEEEDDNRKPAAK